MDAPPRKELHRHFSHEHPLDLIKSPGSSRTVIICCRCCNLSVVSGTDLYYCKTCEFSLHKSCFSFPAKSIQHPSHPKHSLSLLISTPISNSMICKACGEQVNYGFHYSCGACSISYHALCSSLPQSLSTNSHPHELKLEFSLPYDFWCDLCNKPGQNTMWLYRCGPCEFNNHLNCAFRSRKSGPSGGEETMQLLSQKMETSRDVVLARRSNFPEENLYIENSRVCMTPESHHTKPDAIAVSSPYNLQQLDDKSALISIDLTPSPSCQFSESYFSIDLAKFYPSLTPPNSTNKQEKQHPVDLGNKATLVGINEEVFLDWGEPQTKKNLIEIDTSKSISKGSFTSAAVKSGPWKKLFCCT